MREWTCEGTASRKLNVDCVKFRSSNMQDSSVRVPAAGYTSHCKVSAGVNQDLLRVAGALAVL